MSHQQKSRNSVFAFVGFLSAQGAGLYGVTQILVGSGVELTIHQLLNPNAAVADIVVSSSPIITANEAAITPSLFSPKSYSLVSTISKGTTTVAPGADAFSFSFDVVLDLPITVRSGQYVGLVRNTPNLSSSSGVIATEYAVGPVF